MKLSNDPRLSEHPAHAGLPREYDQLCGTCTAGIPPSDNEGLIRLGWCKFLSDGVEVWICPACWPVVGPTYTKAANRTPPAIVNVAPGSALYESMVKTYNECAIGEFAPNAAIDPVTDEIIRSGDGD